MTDNTTETDIATDTIESEIQPAWSALREAGVAHGFEEDGHHQINRMGVLVRAYFATPGDRIFEQELPGGPEGPFVYGVRRNDRDWRHEELYRGLMDAIVRAIELSSREALWQWYASGRNRQKRSQPAA